MFDVTYRQMQACAGTSTVSKAQPPRPMVRLGIVIPCYNEEEVLPETARRIASLLADLQQRGEITEDSGVYFVDDGSRDRTWSLIEELSRSNPSLHGIKLSRNCGHQNALLAGLFHAPGDVVVTIDADLQDDPQAIRGMLSAHRDGADVVYGVRRSRDKDTLFKRSTAQAYYRLLTAFGVDIVSDHADYRLMSRRAIDALRGFGESNLFLRGIVPRLGFPSATVSYDRAERFAGESKYPLRRMLAFAIQGVTSFSAAPLRAITLMGMLVSLLSFAGVAWVLWIRLASSDALPGWASTTLPIFFIGGMQLLALGVIGEYVAKIYMETKQRPRYLIDRMS
ncbi:glycosyltransferase family 2 protein [Piscinibacter sp. XHJ-5]|uniref:glycosyltransferase family 2 protein n=1 Tax=Piscinibacter sp. XHJ-5 TaxID=3037797 RepID=UPI002452CEDF|nr:glycosyltransferase family 2 protein [Piscinibacter sp. XHJ-5]